MGQETVATSSEPNRPLIISVRYWHRAARRRGVCGLPDNGQRFASLLTAGALDTTPLEEAPVRRTRRTGAGRACCRPRAPRARWRPFIRGENYPSADSPFGDRGI